MRRSLRYIALSLAISIALASSVVYAYVVFFNSPDGFSSIADPLPGVSVTHISQGLTIGNASDNVAAPIAAMSVYIRDRASPSRFIGTVRVELREMSAGSPTTIRCFNETDYDSNLPTSFTLIPFASSLCGTVSPSTAYAIVVTTLNVTQGIIDVGRSNGSSTYSGGQIKTSTDGSTWSNPSSGHPSDMKQFQLLKSDA